MARAAIPTAGHTGFSQMAAAEIGIVFTNFLALERHLTNQIFLNGSGVAAGDIDGDGWCDLFFAGLDHGGHLFKNLGQWRFQDITANCFPAQSLLDSTGAVFADVTAPFSAPDSSGSPVSGISRSET